MKWYLCILSDTTRKTLISSLLNTLKTVTHLSMMSAIGMLGKPSEMYRYGTQFGLMVAVWPLVMYSVTNWYLPVFWKIGVSTSYEVSMDLKYLHKPQIS